MAREHRCLARTRLGTVRWRAASMAVAIGCLTAACTSSDEGEAGAEPSGEAIESTAVAEAPGDDDTTEEGSDPATPAVVEPTRDGSASDTDPVSDLWAIEGDGVFTPKIPESIFVDVAVDGVGGLVIGGRLVDHRARLTRASIWRSAADPGTDLTRLELPNLADDVDSSASAVVEPAGGSGVAAAGITTIVAGDIGRGVGQRAAVWIERDGRWEPVSSDAFDSTRATWGRDLVMGDDQILLLGGAIDEGGDSRAAIWSSPDGTTWTRLREPFDERPESSLVDGAVAPVGTVLLGQQETDGITRSSAWFSPDGQTWEALDPPSFRGVGSVVVQSVAATPDGGFVAVGSIGDETDVFQPASWTSADGRTWSEPSTSFELNDLDRTASRGLGARGVHVDGDRFLATSTGEFLPHVWASDDAITWIPVGDVLEAGLETLAIVGIGAAETEVTLIGDGRIVQRLDGTWTARRTSVDVVPKPGEIPWVNDIVSTGSGFLAVGGIQDSGGSLLGRAWSMSDLGIWEPASFSVFRPWDIETGPYQQAITTSAGSLAIGAESVEIGGRRGRPATTHVHAFAEADMRRPAMTEPEDARVMLDEMAVVGDRLVLAGLSFDGVTIEPLIYEGDLHPETFDRLTFTNNDPDDRTALEPVSIGTPRVADRESWTALCASADTVAAVLLEDDSSTVSLQFYLRGEDGTWETSTFEPGIGTDGRSPSVAECIHGPNGFVAVGGFRTGSEGDFEAAMWTSADGTGWNRVDAPGDSADPSTELRFRDLAVFEDRYLIVGSRWTDGVWSAVLWVGTPGGDWLEVPAANQPAGFDPSGVAVDDGGLVIVTGWQDGQATVVSASIEDLLAQG